STPGRYHTRKIPGKHKENTRESSSIPPCEAVYFVLSGHTALGHYSRTLCHAPSPGVGEGWDGEETQVEGYRCAPLRWAAGACSRSHAVKGVVPGRTVAFNPQPDPPDFGLVGLNPDQTGRRQASG